MQKTISKGGKMNTTKYHNKIINDTIKQIKKQGNAHIWKRWQLEQVEDILNKLGIRYETIENRDYWEIRRES